MTTNKSADNCPVERVAEQARRLIDATADLDAQSVKLAHTKQPGKAALNRRERLLVRALRHLEQKATFSHAASARGALFQISLAHAFLWQTEDCADGLTTEAAECLHTVDRLLFSIRSWVEGLGHSSGRECNYYMDPRYDPLLACEEVLEGRILDAAE
jgi:hypothetical protein